MIERETGVIPTERAPALAVPRQPAPLRVSPEYIQETEKALALLRTLIRDVLVKDRDYGSVPGTGDFLWDPGASQIIAAFNCYPGNRRILSLIDDGEKISTIIEVPVISRLSGNEMASGIGASSTMETRHKYRWEENPQAWGYTEEAIKTLKTKEDGGKVKYRILNPEHSELLNVVIKQASKRAEVDAAEALPGVASTLRELFSPSKKGKPGKYTPGEPQGDQETGPKWTTFWSEVRALDLPGDAHVMLRVKSMKDWVAQGKSLDLAVKVLSLMKQGKSFEEAMSEASTERPVKPRRKRDTSAIKTFDDLYQACNLDFGLSSHEAVWKELNVNSQTDITETPKECYERIAAVRG